MSEERPVDRPGFFNQIFAQNEYLIAQEPTVCHGFLLSDVVIMRRIGQVVDGKETAFARPVLGLLDRL